ncbi:penicillin-binding protein 2 [Anoxybacter fermentans]|uniref:Penicillin-binding protein 2 n=1 Tax=Anoxybacter fermentans TaxID=1323375 RepID=A0A3Q9HQK1_9FIRM|nr:penicillin-binding protein 2 [Anoxybacter fermentans]AZR73285.1 penicillin-binding protein 2 [Anoxybacter fermentans]
MAISQKMERRIFIFGSIIVMIFFVLVLRLAYLQLVQGEKFYQLAENNRINFQTIGAPRGKIYTVDGKILVSNKMAYSVSIKEKELNTEEDVKRTIDGLSTLLKLDGMEIIRQLVQNVIDGKVILMDKLTPEEKMLLLENIKKLPGMSIEQKVDGKGNLQKEYLQVNLRAVSTSNLLNACKTLSELFSLKYEDLLIKIIVKGLKDRDILRIKRNLTQEEMVILEEHLNDLPGVVIEKISVRDYVYGSLASHVLGYMGAISPEELQMLKDKGYRGDDYIGKAGLERYYESYLRGQNGLERFEVDSRNRKIRTLGVNTPLPGANLFINLDLKLQQKAEELLEKKLAELREEAKDDPEMMGGPTGGAVIIMNPQNGKILAMTSKPNFNLNLFAGGISPEDLQKLNNDPLLPFINRTITPQPAGSIFKLVTAAAVLEEKVIDENTIIYDANGTYQIGEWTYNNWAKRGYGPLNVVDAIAYSNNIFFYNVAHQLYKMGKGGITIPQYARAFGLGQLTGIDLPREEKGLVPDREWKEKTYGQIWLPGESLHLSIGQGYLQTTPLQLINLVSAIGNGGKLYRPYIVDRIESYDGKIIKQFEPKVIGRLPVSKKNLEIIKKGMIGATTYGTARKAFADFPITVAGKTGTAQTGAGNANHGWFAGFAPADNPEIAILVYIEHGVSSSRTLSIARDLLKYYFKIPDPLEEEKTESDDAALSEELHENEELVNQKEKEKEPGFSDKLKKFFNEVFSL